MESGSALQNGDLMTFSFQEKSHWLLVLRTRGARGENIYFTVPQTDTGGLVEKTKAIGRRMIKELGTKAGRNLWEMPYLSRGQRTERSEDG